jgi:hypothetical protein
MARKFSSVRELAVQVAQDPALAQQIRENPAQGIAASAAPLPPLQTDVWIYRAVIIALSAVVLATVIGVIALAWTGKSDPPQTLTAIGSTAVGALAGLLAPYPNSRPADGSTAQT